MKCEGQQRILSFDVCSLYPSINALDGYAVGSKKYYKPTTDEIMDDPFIGVVKCEVIPPKNL